jgi:hypothetical protein
MTSSGFESRADLQLEQAISNFLTVTGLAIVHQSNVAVDDKQPNSSKAIKKKKKHQKGKDLPSLCNNNVVKWLVLVAEAREADSDDHFDCFESLTFVTGKQIKQR